MNGLDEHATISSEASILGEKGILNQRTSKTTIVESKKLTKSLRPSLKSTKAKNETRNSPVIHNTQSLAVLSSEGSESSNCSFVYSSSFNNKFERIKLNVGGQKFETTLFTLQQYPGYLTSCFLSFLDSIFFDSIPLILSLCLILSSLKI
jgi:hypothetical protein